MIRIAFTAEDGTTEWREFAKVHIDQVTPFQGLRFDQDLAELHAQGVDLGVKRWTEVIFWLRRFSAEASEKACDASSRIGDLAEAAKTDPGAAERLLQVAEAEEQALSLWMAQHPWYELARQVAIWVAVNAGARRMSLLQVLQLRPADVEEIPDVPAYIEDEPAAVDPGKA